VYFSMVPGPLIGSDRVPITQRPLGESLRVWLSASLDLSRRAESHASRLGGLRGGLRPIPGLHRGLCHPLPGGFPHISPNSGPASRETGGGVSTPPQATREPPPPPPPPCLIPSVPRGARAGMPAQGVGNTGFSRAE